MPTGYTAPIHDTPEFSFEDYARRCARAFGPFIMLRDEPLGNPLPARILPETTSLEMLAASHQARADRLSAMSEAERVAYGRAKLDDQLEEAQMQIEADQAVRDRADAIRRRVEAWMPPTPDHEGLQRFMLEQLKVDFGGQSSVVFYQARLARARTTEPVDLWARDREEALDAVARARTAVFEEQERAATRDAWLQDLFESLGDGRRSTNGADHA